MSIDEIVDRAMTKASKELAGGNLNLRSIIYMAVQSGMADAYERGQKVRKS